MKIIVDVPDGKYCEGCKFMDVKNLSLNPTHRCFVFDEILRKEKISLEYRFRYNNIKCSQCQNGGE
jgi:hypothetical protein